SRGGRWRLAAGAVAVLLGGANVPALKQYVRMSGGQSIVAEVPDASRVRIASRIPKLLKRSPCRHIILDSSNVVLIKLFALYAKGLNVYVPSQDAFEGIWECSPVDSAPRVSKVVDSQAGGPVGHSPGPLGPV